MNQIFRCNENKCLSIEFIPIMFSTCSNHYTWDKLQEQESPQRVAFSGPSMFSMCSNLLVVIQLG